MTSARPSALRQGSSTRTLSRNADGGVVTRTVLPGGLRVITESMPGARSVVFGVWVGVGSRDESPGLAGASHYLEHLLFKGTERRSALEVAAAVEAVGGELNAFTTKESTCYYAHVLDADLPLAVDVVSDVVTSATLPAPEVENERGVILDEIAMRDDDPSDLVGDLFDEALFGDTPLGRPVLGTVQSIRALRRDAIAGYYRRRYRPAATVVAAAGRLQHEAVVEQVARAFAVPSGPDGAMPLPPRTGSRPPRRPARPVAVLERPTEQANLLLGMVGLPRADERRYTLGVLNYALGGGMSSRLFQEVREKRGLAYSVYSFAERHAGTGSFGVSAACQPAKVHQVLDVVREQLADIAGHGLRPAELELGRGQARGSVALGLEDPSSRMSRIGRGELADGEVLQVEEVLARIDAVTAADVGALAAELLRRPRCLAVVGPFGESDFDDVVR